jgi:hypothetical protein
MVAGYPTGPRRCAHWGSSSALRISVPRTALRAKRWASITSWAGFALLWLLYVVAFLLGPETRGRSLDELDPGPPTSSAAGR